MSEEKSYNNEKKNQKKEEDKKNQHFPQDIIAEGITFIRCPIHNLSYPKGASCPKCDLQKDKNKNA